MFYYIKGKLVFSESSQAVIDVGGVAYSMTVSANTQASVSSSSFNGQTDVLLYTHLSVREDGIDLFGFKDLDELDMFKKLISVSGIGPKAAMSVLSFMTPGDVAAAIFSEDKRSISKAPGIGPKTAARIILELKDKVNKDGCITPIGDTSYAVPNFNNSKYSEAIDALTVLGFHRTAAEDALKAIDVNNMDLEEIIRSALKKLMK